jgi:hypothetical protein
MNSSSPTVWLRTTSSASLATPPEDRAMTAPKVGLPGQRVDAEALDDVIHVHPVQHSVQIDLVQQRIHIQRGTTSSTARSATARASISLRGTSRPSAGRRR